MRVPAAASVRSLSCVPSAWVGWLECDLESLFNPGKLQGILVSRNRTPRCGDFIRLLFDIPDCDVHDIASLRQAGLNRRANSDLLPPAIYRHTWSNIYGRDPIGRSIQAVYDTVSMQVSIVPSMLFQKVVLFRDKIIGS